MRHMREDNKLSANVIKQEFNIRYHDVKGIFGELSYYSLPSLTKYSRIYTHGLI
jgi:hypothetical protein